VGHPLLESHPSHALAQKLLPTRGAGAVFSFDIKGSRAQGKAFIEALKLFSHLANVGDCRSAGDPPGQHDALPHDRRGAGGRRHRRGRSACRSDWKTRPT
jgi:O-acetylhomoserine (thiol)-lyase